MKKIMFWYSVFLFSFQQGLNTEPFYKNKKIQIASALIIAAIGESFLIKNLVLKIRKTGQLFASKTKQTLIVGTGLITTASEGLLVYHLLQKKPFNFLPKKAKNIALVISILMKIGISIISYKDLNESTILEKISEENSTEVISGTMMDDENILKQSNKYINIKKLGLQFEKFHNSLSAKYFIDSLNRQNEYTEYKNITNKIKYVELYEYEYQKKNILRVCYFDGKSTLLCSQKFYYSILGQKYLLESDS